MSELAETIQIGDTAFERVETPEGIACWAADAGVDGTVSIVVEPAAEPGDDARATAAEVVGAFDELVERAVEFLRERLRAAPYELDAGELALLDAEPAPFGEPEAAVWDDGTWMLRFAESPLAMAADYGIGVLFIGAAPQSVEDLSDAEESEH